MRAFAQLLLALVLTVCPFADVKAEQITWTYSTLVNYSTGFEEGHEDIPEDTSYYRVSLEATGVPQTEKMTQMYTGRGRPELAEIDRFSPVHLSVNFLEIRDSAEPSWNITAPGTLILRHQPTSDVERWSFATEFTEFPHSPAGDFTRILEQLEGDGMLGPYPYQLYGTHQATFNRELAEGEIGIVFFEPLESGTVQETPEPSSLLLAVLGLTGVVIGTWRQKKRYSLNSEPV